MNPIQTIIFLTFAASSAFAQSGFEDGYELPVIENIISCAMLDGFFTHNISKVNGDFKGHVSFPIYDVPLSPEELKTKRLEFAVWAEADTQARLAAEAKAIAEGLDKSEAQYESKPPPGDTRRIGVSIPVTNSSIMSSDQSRLSKRIDFFNSIFPSVERSEFISFDIGKLFLDFNEDECEVNNVGALTSIICSTEAIKELNGTPIDRITMHMANQKIIELALESEDFNKPSAERKLVPRAKNLVVTTVTFYQGNKYYPSSFTYSPNGNDRACSVMGETLQEFAD